MASEQNYSNAREDEISLKSLILTLQEYTYEILKYWKLVAFVAIPFSLFFLWRAVTTLPVYSAGLTFMLNENDGGGLGGTMGLLSQFGLGGGGGGKYNLEKMMELSKTMRIVQLSMFDKIDVNDKNDYIANHIIDLYDLHEDWEDSDTDLKGFKFSHDSVAIFTRTENIAMKAVYGKIIGDDREPGIYKSFIDDETGIMTLIGQSMSEPLSIHIITSLFDHLSQYYIDKTVEKQKRTYDVVKTKVDSIGTELNNAEYELAQFQDSHRKLLTRTANLKKDRLSRKIKILILMYGEAIKNLEIAEFSLKNKTPFIQLIDEPITPLYGIGQSRIKAIIIGGVLGAFLAIGFIAGRKVLRDVMA